LVVKIPLVDLKAQYQTIRSEIREAIDEVLETTAFIGGPANKQLEKAFADFCQVPEAVVCDSGTSALHLAFVALGVGPGDEVILPSWTFVATGETVCATGAKVRFVDIDETTYCMDPESVRKSLTDRTKLVVAVHIYGHPCDMDALNDVVKGRNVTVIEDAAQSHGALYKGHRVGGLGPVATFSFYPGKNLGAYGDGGMVTVRDAEMADRIRRLSDHGRGDKYTHRELGYNYRMDTMQAAILLVKLRHLEKWNEARRNWASVYTEKLAGVEEVQCPQVSPDVVPVYHLYVVRVPRRDAVFAELKEAGIGAGVHYPVPLHLQPSFEFMGMKEGDLPLTEKVAGEVLSLPLYPELDEEKADYVVETLKSALVKTRAA
jgi:dTDP-4-amino-4,6-dideoxygalactose transaminase